MIETGKNILMVNLPFSGHTNPTLELAKTFISLGHNVTYINAPGWKNKIENTGATFVPYDNYPATLSESQKEMKSWSAAYQTVQRIGKAFDCLVYEMLFLPGKAIADQLGIPSFRLFSTFTLNEKVLADFGKSGGWYLTSIFRFPILCKLMSKIICKKFNLRYDNIIREIVNNAPGLNFTYTIKDFQVYADEFDDNHYKYVGPSIGKRDEKNFDFSAFKFPIVYISLGTLLNTSVKFFRTCIEAFREQPVSVIISIGDIDVKKLGKIPNNIFVYSFVPQLQVLEQASLFITHGGMNSVNEALYYGVPMLVIPVGNDQPTVALQIENLHLGKYVRRKGLTPVLLKKAANEVLADTSYKDVLHKFQLKSQAAGGNQEIVRLILSKLNQNYNSEK